MRWMRLLPAVIAALGLARGAPELWVAPFALVAVLFLPGRGFARRWSRDPIERFVLSFWLSGLLAAPAVLGSVAFGFGGVGVLAFSVTATAVGDRLSAPRATRSAPAARIGFISVVLATCFIGVTRWGDVSRPLDRYWWYPPAESAWDGRRASVVPEAGGGWRERERVGWDSALAWRMEPKNEAPFLLGPASGPFILALRGPVGATMTVGRAKVRIDAQVEEDDEEGPVARYLMRGVAALTVDLALNSGEKLTIELSHPAKSTVYLLGGPDAVWALHSVGELRHTHYYQILNMVEQLRWAQELFADRRVTDVQPPLPAYILGAPLSVTAGEIPTTNLLFLLELLAVGAAGVVSIAAFAPRAPLLAWMFPAVATAQHGRLMLEPGSAMLPDTLYTVALLGTVAALARPKGRFAFFGLLAALCRYPGSLVALLAAALAVRPRPALRLIGLLGLLGVLSAVGGWISGSLDHWLETVHWEIGPEHWHGEYDPLVLLSRTPRFYGLWMAYAGGLPLLAALRWPVGTRITLGTALVYSLLLCTIDHSPSHYFLPLLHLSAIAAAITASTFERPASRNAFSIVGLVGMIVAYTLVQVVG